ISPAEHPSASWIGHTKKDLMHCPEIGRESGAPGCFWSLSRQKLRPMQERLACLLTGIIHIRLFLRSPGLPSARANSTLVSLLTFRNSITPDHFTTVEAGSTSIFRGSSLQASRSSTLRWAHCRTD